MTPKSAVRERRWRLWQQMPLLVALVLLWMFLWSTISLLSFATGILVAVAVTRLFYLPAVELSGRFNPLWFVVFLARFFVDLVRGSFEVAFQALRPRGVRHNAIVAADLDTRSDFIMTLTAISISLIPGSLVVEVDRQDSILYLHAINVDDAEGAARLRDRVRDLERRLVRALGSKDDVRRLSS